MKELLMIQMELKAPKDKYNKFGNYQYRSCEGILEAVKPLAAEQNCTLILNDELVMIGDRYYVKATATLTNLDGKSVCASAYAREQDSKTGMDASQLTGSTSSYARKYALNALFCIDDTKDADDMDNTSEGHSHQPAPQPQDERPWMSDSQFKSCLSRISAGDLDVLDKAKESFKMKKEYREKLEEAAKYYKTTHP